MNSFVCIILNYRSLLPFVLLISAVFLAYANVYENVFLFDDQITIVNNAMLHSRHLWSQSFLTTWGAGDNLTTNYYRPIQTLIYALLVQLSVSPSVFHLLNVVVHALNACLVYQLGQKLNFKHSVALGAALVWALHPLQTETVTYVSDTADGFYTFFCLVCVIVLLPRVTTHRLMIAVPLMALGLLCKEAAVILPLLIMSSLYLSQDKRFDPRTYFCLWPMLLLAFLYVALHLIFLDHIFGTSVHERASEKYNLINYGSLTVLVKFLKLIIWPSHLHFEHALPAYENIWHWDVFMGGALAVTALVLIMRRQTTCSLPISWGLFWLLSAYLPYVPADTSFYEHWFYLPSIGLFLGTLQALALCVEKSSVVYSRLVRNSGLVAFLLLIFFEGILTYQQNRVWRDPLTFYNNIFDQGEKAAKAHANLGNFYIQKGDYKNGILQSEIAIKNSDDTLASAETNLAIAQLMSSLPAHASVDALKHLQRALIIEPDYYPALIALAQFYKQHGDDVNATLYQKRAEQVHQHF